MKSYLLAFTALITTLPTLHAQVTLAQGSPSVVVVRTLDPVAVQRHLSLPPKVTVVTPPPAPAAALKTTKTTTVVETPGQPTRVYNSERSTVLVENNGQSNDLLYVTLPVLFVKETSELLDAESRAALQEVANVIFALSKAEPNTKFDIEGHTSTDGTDKFNLDLSASRAQRVFDELTQTYGVPASVLTAHGYGESFPMYPQGDEVQMQQDRRVLVVRTN